MHAPGLPSDPQGTAQPSSLPVPLAAGLVEAVGGREPVQERAEWEMFYRDHKDEVFRVVLAVVGNRDQAADAVNEAFCRAFARWERIGPDPDRRRRWVIRTALNYVKRSWQRVEQRETSEQRSRSHEPTTKIETKELVRQLLQQLPPRQREVIALRYLADLDPKEITQVLEITPNTVAVHHHRGMKVLRATLENGGEAP